MTKLSISRLIKPWKTHFKSLVIEYIWVHYTVITNLKAQYCRNILLHFLTKIYTDYFIVRSLYIHVLRYINLLTMHAVVSTLLKKGKVNDFNSLFFGGLKQKFTN